MTVYVDAPVWKKSKTGRKSYSHMIADSLNELHEFAVTIGVKQHFFHSTAKHLHYDITAEQYDIALNAGAVEVSSKDIVKISNKDKK